MTNRPLSEQRKNWEIYSWAKKTRGHLNLSQKAVLMILADYYNAAYDYAWPTTQQLAEDAEVHGRTILTHLHNLQKQGFITIHKGATGYNHRANAYSLHFDRIHAELIDNGQGNGEETPPLELEPMVTRTSINGEVDVTPMVTSTSSNGGVCANTTPKELPITNNEQLTDLENLQESMKRDVNLGRSLIETFAYFPNAKVLTVEFIREQYAKHKDDFKVEEINSLIGEALNSKAFKGWQNKLIGISRWLDRNREWKLERGGGSQHNPKLHDRRVQMEKSLPPLREVKYQ